MASRRSVFAPLAVVAVAVATGGWFLQQGVTQERNAFFQARLLDEVLRHVEDRYVDPVDAEELYNDAIQGVISGLDDPNSSFMDADSWENLRIRTEGEYGGVGLEIQALEGWVTVMNPIPGGPGARSGIRSGDRFFEVEGQSAAGWSADQAVERLRGSPGSSVNVKMLRPGVEEPIPFTLTREVITVKSVPFSALLEENVGYVPLQMVSETSPDEVRAALDSLITGGATSVILDLRGNPGGLLDAGIAVTDFFLGDGMAVVETRGRAPGQNGIFRAETPDQYPDLPLVVLVDQQSASASEIIAGAIQDHDRGLVVGMDTFGKGSVQSLFQLTGGNALRLTTARWYTPRGRSIHKDLERQMSAFEGGALTVTGALSVPPDTAGRPRVESAGGRVLLGGGGVTPDVLVMLDTLSTDGQEAVRDLYGAAGTFNSVLFNWVAETINGGASLPPSFQLTEAMVESFLARLRSEAPELEPDVLAGARPYIRYQLERELALQAFGPAAEFRRALPYDAQLQEALRLLGSAESPQALVARAQEPVFVTGG